MESSASTPSPWRRPPVRLLVRLDGEDHPKACTGRRLVRWGRVERVGPGNVAAPVTLDPYAPTPLSPADRAAAGRGGVLAIDCSWNRLTERGRFPGERSEGRTSGRRRRLPLLVAANPQHYGRLTQLNTAEALSAALYVLGYSKDADRLLEGFRGGSEFLGINRERLDRYAAAVDANGVLAVESEMFGSA